MKTQEIQNQNEGIDNSDAIPDYPDDVFCQKERDEWDDLWDDRVRSVGATPF